MIRSAVISDDGLYRYRLERHFGTGVPARPLGVIMVNPSTADAEKDDATIRRLVGFAERYRRSSIIVGNLFALRSPDVRHLASAEDPVGPENDDYLERLFSNCGGEVFVGWGASSKIPRSHRSRIDSVAELAECLDCDLYCWGTTGDGSPRHPLFVPYDQDPERWSLNRG